MSLNIINSCRWLSLLFRRNRDFNMKFLLFTKETFRNAFVLIITHTDELFLFFDWHLRSCDISGLKMSLSICQIYSKQVFIQEHNTMNEWSNSAISTVVIDLVLACRTSRWNTSEVLSLRKLYWWIIQFISQSLINYHPINTRTSVLNHMNIIFLK